MITDILEQLTRNFNQLNYGRRVQVIICHPQTHKRLYEYLLEGVDSIDRIPYDEVKIGQFTYQGAKVMRSEDVGLGGFELY